MVRRRFHTTIALGRFNEGLTWARELNAACRANGVPESRVLMPSFGKVNQLILEVEFADMAAMEKSDEIFFASADIMRVFRRGVELGAAGTHPWDELEQEAPQQLA